MSYRQSVLELLIKGDNRDAVAALKGATAAAGQFADGTIGHFGRVVGSVLNLRNAVIGAGAAMAAKLLIEPAMKLETAQTQLGVLLQDAEAGAKLMDELLDFSASTPFQFADLQGAAQRLLAVGVSAGDVTTELRMLGDIAQGDARKLDTVTNAYGKMRAKGRVSLEELNMLTEAGIPILARLAEGYGTSTAELFKMVSAGKVGFGDVQKAMRAMTSEGGQFYKMMEKMSLTTAGQLSTLKDNWNLALADVGAELLPTVNEAMLNLLATIRELRESGKLQEWGAEVAQVLGDTLDKLERLAKFVIANREIIANLGITYAVVKTIFAINGALVALQSTLVATAATAGGFKAAMLAMAGPAGIGLVIAAATLAALKLREMADEANDLYAQTERMERSKQGQSNLQVGENYDRFVANYMNKNPQATSKQAQRAYIEFATQHGTVDKVLKSTGADKEIARKRAAAAPPPEPIAEPEPEPVVDNTKDIERLLDQEADQLADIAEAEADRAQAADRKAQIDQIEATIKLHEQEAAAAREAAAALRDQAAAAQAAAAANFRAVALGQVPAAAPAADRAAQRAADREDRQIAAAEADLAEARRRQERGFRNFTPREQALIEADDARREAKGIADVAAGEQVKADRAAAEAAALQADRDRALAKFAEQDFAAKMDREHAKLEEIRAAIAALGVVPAPAAPAGPVGNSPAAPLATAPAPRAPLAAAPAPVAASSMADNPIWERIRRECARAADNIEKIGVA